MHPFAVSSHEQKHRQHPLLVKAALEHAGPNRSSLEQMLAYYQPGSLEYRAACFLVSHMPYHTTGGRILEVDPLLDSTIHAACHDYAQLINGTSAQEQESDPLHRKIKLAAQESAKHNSTRNWKEPQLRVEEKSDVEAINGDFIRRQVDYVCKLRRNSPILQQMSEEDFFDYVLPYRSVTNYPLVTTADTLGRMFGPFLQARTDDDAVSFSERYNRTTWWLRHWGGTYPFDDYIGWREMFFARDFHDCVDMAFYGAQIYRACGWPACVEYNTGYKLWNGRHFDLVVPLKVGGEWLSFSPETELPRPANERFKHCLNIYRLHFASQSDSPAMLHAAGEPIPEELKDACIEDVSSHYVKVCSLNQPIPSGIPTAHRLAYLASFKSHRGWEPVTWGMIDRTNGCIRFAHVVTDNIYLPMALDSQGRMLPISAPFKLEASDALPTVVTPQSKCYQPLLSASAQTKKTTALVKRKFPRKPSMLTCAQRAVGTVVLASDQADFSHADTLAVIRKMPEDVWTDLPLSTHRPYLFYRVSAPQTDPHLQLSELQFLVPSSCHTPNAVSPTPLDGGTQTDSLWQRVLDEPLEKSQKKAEYDGNVQTAPDRWPNVTLRLQQPQLVTRLRFMVKHADNHVKANGWYTLHHWTGHGWEDAWTGITTTNHLPALPLDVGGLYWLEDLRGGQEELPFLIRENGSQEFPHEWLLKK